MWPEPGRRDAIDRIERYLADVGSRVNNHEQLGSLLRDLQSANVFSMNSNVRRVESWVSARSYW